MGAVRMLAGSEFRRRWRGVVALTVLVGVVGAVVLATVAGVRRSDSALDRFKAWSRAGDVELLFGRVPTATEVAALRRLPGVEAMAVLNGLALQFPRVPNLGAIASAVDSKFGTVVDRARIGSGRAANPEAAHEVMIGETLAAQLHLHVGDRLDGKSLSVAQVTALLAGAGTAFPATFDGPHVRLRIVGIGRRPLDLGDRGASGGVLVLTPAFDREFTNKTVGSFSTVLRIRTRHGAADVPRVVAGARRILSSARDFKVQPLDIESEGASGAINVLTVALWIFGGVAALAGVVAIGIVLSREIWLVSVDHSTLRALGLTRRQRVVMNGAPALVVAGAGAVLAVLGALGASPLFPIGLARQADPDPGFHVDWFVVALGVVAVAAVVLAIGFLAALRSAARWSRELDPGARRRPSRLVEVAARAGLAPTATNGLRMAIEPGRGQTAVPVRSAYLGAVFGIVGLIAVLMFASSVNHLASTPNLYGWTFDYAASDNAGSTCNRADYGLARVHGVEAVAALCTSTVDINRDNVAGWGFLSLHGTVGPEIVQGRAPTGPRDVALGSITLHNLGKRIGDNVRISGPNAKLDYRIVGRVVLATLDSPQPLANGAVFSQAGFNPVSDPNNTNRYLVARYAPGVNPSAVQHRITPIHQLGSPIGRVVPPEVNRLRQIHWFPTTLAALLATLALLAVGHALITAVRRRRRDLALLKTLGFNRHQVRATVAWQATTLGTVGLIVGIPIGILVGSIVWRLVANGVGVSTTAAIPTLAVLLTIPAVLAVVNLIAYLPARSAARTRPAVALRAE